MAVIVCQGVGLGSAVRVRYAQPTWDGTRLSRAQIQQVPCPHCRADVGAQCIQLGGQPRQRNHIERMRARKRVAEA